MVRLAHFWLCKCGAQLKMRSDMAGFDKNRAVPAICVLIALATLLLYWPATRNGFVNMDDNDYIIDNVHVTSGLTWAGIGWAFTHSYASNWHPLTWISHMLDCQLYGLNPAGHHLTSILLHIANSLLVFLLFRRMTGSLWRSAFVAAFFAWHPLHVESVAWASERKDVLSTLFWLLTMIFYVRYAQASQAVQPRARRFYGLALLCFVLGLMSKAMLVTLPFVLLLLDYWPLRRTAPGAVARDEQPGLGSLAWGRLVAEKLPFFALALAASVVTYLVQQRSGAVSTLEELPLPARVANAGLSYFQYISKTLWPAGLAAFYPFQRHPPAALVATAFVLLAAFSGLFALAAQRRPVPRYRVVLVSVASSCPPSGWSRWACNPRPIGACTSPASACSRCLSGGWTISWPVGRPAARF